MSLADVQIRNLSPEPGKKLRLFDGRGLYLEVSPTGRTYWRLKYRYAGKEKVLALGVYCEAIFAFAIAAGKCKHNPAAGIGRALAPKPPTESFAAVTEPFNPDQNIAAGTRYVTILMWELHGDLRLVAAAKVLIGPWNREFFGVLVSGRLSLS